MQAWRRHYAAQKSCTVATLVDLENRGRSKKRYLRIVFVDAGLVGFHPEAHENLLEGDHGAREEGFVVGGSEIYR